MGSLSDYAELELLDHVFNAAYSSVATVYIGLSTADPLDDASGLAEPVGNNYAREAITFGAAASRRVTQSGAVTFNLASGPWGTLSHWALFDTDTGGQMLAHGSLAASKSVVAGNTPSIDTTEVYVEFSAGEISDYCAVKLLDRMFRNQAFAKPDTYVALIITNPVADGDDGTEITEPSGGSYARKLVNINGGAAPDWDLAALGVVDNSDDITFVTATGNWGTIIAVAIVDDPDTSEGQVLFYDNAMADQAVSSGDTVKFNAGDLDIVMS